MMDQTKASEIVQSLTVADIMREAGLRLWVQRQVLRR